MEHNRETDDLQSLYFSSRLFCCTKENKTIVCIIQKIALAKFSIPIIPLSELAKDCKTQ